MRDMFLAMLSDIPVRDLTKALFVHVNKSDEIPTPRQLRDIIHPPPEPEVQLSAAHYVTLMKKVRDGAYLYGDDKEFVDAFRDQQNRLARKGVDTMRQCNEEIEQHSRTMLTYEGE